MLLLFIDMAMGAATVEKVLLAVVGALIVFDIYLYFDHVAGNTISRILHDWVYRDSYFFIPYLWGVLGGHFFLGVENSPFQYYPNGTLYSLGIVLGSALIVLIFGIYIKRKEKLLLRKKILPLIQFTLLVLGAVIGHFFWSLKFYEMP